MANWVDYWNRDTPIFVNTPFRAERRMARALVQDNEFCEVFVDAPISVAESRDPKSLYKKARRGELKNFTGIDSPYEPPEHASQLRKMGILDRDGVA